MCKVLAITNGTKVKNMKLLVNRALHHITKIDDDGFGWAALGKRGVFGERMTDMSHGYRLDRNHYAVKLPLIKETYNSFGTPDDVTGPIIFHGRTSTNVKSLINTHPIIKNGWTLIHNGVVQNQGPDYKQETTNDTEHLVHYMSTQGIRAVEEHLSGYYAVCAIDPVGSLHVFKDDYARLHVAWIKSIESYMFATTADLIQNLCSEMKWKRGPIEVVQDNIYTVMMLNETIKQEKINPYGFEKYGYEASRMSRSLGYEYDWRDDYKWKAPETKKETPLQLASPSGALYTKNEETGEWTRHEATTTQDDAPQSMLDDAEALEASLSDADAIGEALELINQAGFKYYGFNGIELTYKDLCTLDDDELMDVYVQLPKGDNCFFQDIVEDIKRKAC